MNCLKKDFKLSCFWLLPNDNMEGKSNEIAMNRERKTFEFIRNSA